MRPVPFEQRLRHIGEHVTALSRRTEENAAPDAPEAAELRESVDELREAQRELEREYGELVAERERLRAQHADAQRRTSEIARLNTELERRVQERTAELERLNAAKDEFLGLISHELKAPIAVILGNAEVLTKRAQHLTDRQRIEALYDIHSEADRLHHIIDNLLVLARLERGQEVAREPLHVPHLISRAVNQHLTQHPERPFYIDVQQTLPYVEAAPVYVEQVLRNFISNAEKYSAGDATIEVHAWRDRDDVVVAVDDHGEGVPEYEAQNLFTPFYRSPRTRELAEGAGIGLAVCKRLIEAQGGRVWAERLPQAGMRFAFALRRVSEARAEAD